jgi:hypothetical protein
MSANCEKSKCTITVRNLPLERFRLPNDGRKWKQAARSRQGVLEHLSTFANGDGTFVRSGRNFSPSWERLTKRFAEKSLDRHCDALRKLGYLAWTRLNHYTRRVYTIHLSDSLEKHPSDSEEHLSDSTEKLDNTCHIDADHLSHWPKTPATMDGVPSLPSKPPSTPPSPTAPHDDDGGDENRFQNQRHPREVPELEAGPNRREMQTAESGVLTEQQMVDILQRAHVEALDTMIDERGYFAGVDHIPRAASVAGSRPLFDELRAKGVTKLAQMPDVVAAYKDWFAARYTESFEEHSRVESRNMDENRSDFVPEAIKYPFSRFRKELQLFLDDAREWQEEADSRLADALEAKPLPKDAVIAKVRNNGISEALLKRAAAEIVDEFAEGGIVMWKLRPMKKALQK